MRRLALAALTALATLAAAEAVVRALAPTPRAQIVRADTPGLRPIGDTVTWRLPGPVTDRLENAGCRAPEAVLLVGDSVLYVMGPGDPVDANVAVKLQEALSTAGAPVCVQNLAQPGLLPAQVRAVADEAIARRRPDALVAAVWKDDRALTRIGDDWYDLDRYARAPGAAPTPLGLPVPQPLQRALMARSRLWEYATLALAPVDDTTALGVDAYRALLDDAAAAQIPVVLVEFTPLDRPFGEGARMAHHREVEALAAARGVPYLRVAEALRGLDVARARADTCCHLAAPGHAALAAALAPVVREALDGATP